MYCTTYSTLVAHIGLGVFGPCLVKYGRSTVKIHGLVFSCLITRAINLEVLNSLDTSTFNLGFIRFCCRRAYPLKVMSDNGRNTVGAVTELRNVGLKSTKLLLFQTRVVMRLIEKFLYP